MNECTTCNARSTSTSIHYEYLAKTFVELLSYQILEKPTTDVASVN